MMYIVAHLLCDVCMCLLSRLESVAWYCRVVVVVKSFTSEGYSRVRKVGQARHPGWTRSHSRQPRRLRPAPRAAQEIRASLTAFAIDANRHHIDQAEHVALLNPALGLDRPLQRVAWPG